MPAPPFLFANILGALMWTLVVGYLSFHFGSLIHRVGQIAAPVVSSKTQAVMQWAETSSRRL
jgi:membrane protein DedA with SNARE-associated domain